MAASPKTLIVKYYEDECYLAWAIRKAVGALADEVEKKVCLLCVRSIGFNLYLFWMQMHTNFSNTELMKIGISRRFRHVSQTGNCHTNEN